MVRSDNEKNIPIVKASSVQEMLGNINTIADIFKSEGVLVLRGSSFSVDDQIAIAKALGDIFEWNLHKDAPQSAIDTAIYQGGHSDQVDREYNQGPDEYVLDWHIEQVYYVYPILAGIWNMTTFTASPDSGNTRFVDSAELYSLFNEDDRDFLSKSVVSWDKPAPHGTGPFYTKVVDRHPITGVEMLRVETDHGCYSMPKLALIDGNIPTEEQVLRLDSLLAELKDNLNNNSSIRYSQAWQENDILIVDLFRMYHSVMGGFSQGQRKFTGIGIRPRTYDNSMYTTLEA